MAIEFRDRYQRFVEINQESRFATKQEITESAECVHLSHPAVKKAGLPLMVQGDKIWIDGADHHNLIMGSTRTGKTRRLILIFLHLLMKASGSIIVIDVKGELKRMTSGFAKSQGYKIVDLNLRDFTTGDQWNPLEEPYKLYHHGQQDEANMMLADFMSGLSASKFRGNVDPFWPGQATILGQALLQLMCECFPMSYANPYNLTNIGSEANHEALEELVNKIAYTSPAAVKFRGSFSSAEKTRQSIEVTLYDMLKLFVDNERLARWMQKTSFDMHKIGEDETVVYIEIADEKDTYHPVVSMFIKQLYEVLVGDAKKKPSGSLDLPVHFVMDEFCNIPKIDNMHNMITAAASRNIFLTLVVQSYHQLERLYGADSETIKGNCQNWYYLFSRELSMLNELSDLCGEIDTPNGKRKLISISELQRFKMGETLVMHDRLYPYVTRFPDITEYDLPMFSPVEADKIKKAELKTVSLKAIAGLIEKGAMPMPFAGEMPAVDVWLEN